MKTQRALVYGEGVSGRVAAYFLVNAGYKVDIYDPYRESKISTLFLRSGMAELAANSIMLNEDVKKLLQDINVEYFSYFSSGKKKYVAFDGRVTRWPLSFFETLGSLSSFYNFKKTKAHPQETLNEWGKRWNERVSKNLIFPALQGIYGDDIENLSASLIINKEKKSKALSSVSFPRGMGQFMDALKLYLEKKGVKFLNTLEQEYDFKVVSTPTYSLPDVVSKEDKEILSEIEYQKITTVTVFLKKENKAQKKGFGCVFKEKPLGALGVIFNTDLFEGRAKEGLISETWIFSGLCEKKALENIKSIRKKFFNQESVFIESFIKEWDKAFPKYDLKLEKALKNLSQTQDLFYFANWTGNLGIGSFISSGSEFIKKIKKTRGEL